MDAYDQGADRTRDPDPADPPGPGEPAPEPPGPDRTGPAERSGPGESSEAADLSEPRGAAAPSGPGEPSGPADLSEPGGAAVPDGHTGPSRPTGPVAPGPLPEPSGPPAPSEASAPVGAVDRGGAGPAGVAALSPRYQVVAALALAVAAVTVCVHLGMVFLHVAPSNTLSKQHSGAIDDWVYPEFEQNWKLFAPNPLQQNIAVQVRADVGTADGGVRTTGWYDLSAEDGRAIDGNPLPSHTQQNELRRAWDFFLSTHDANNRPNGQRGALARTYLTRIVLLRLGREDAAGDGGTVQRVQVRSRTTNVPPPRWSGEKVSDRPTYRVLPWWPISDADLSRDAKPAGAAQ
ncbi:DUF5819 family protein [Streptomyces sp. NPDC005840]|uniref:DUF5819 family protein n=1 Tax=Streptomyces sp. NPDC005840 TaxID=3157072 RepID=UPI0033EB7E70